MSKQSLGRVSMVPKGAYSALTAYKRLDVVTHDGASYIVLRPVQGVTPVDGEDYMLLVQDGDTPDLSIGTVDTLAAGSKATASIGGTPDKPELNFGIPKGDTGAAPVLKMGKVTTLEPGSEASASLSGTAEEPELNLNIPRGASGGVDVASAEVGQTIIVKAVDENGKPTEWEAVDMVSGSGELTILYAATLEEATTEIKIDKNTNGDPLLLTEWDIIVHVPGTFADYATTCYIYAVDGDAKGFKETFISNDSSAVNIMRYRTVLGNFVECAFSKYAPSGSYVNARYYENGVVSKQVLITTYNAEKPLPVGAYVEVRGK